jgi:MFS family permease
MTERPAALRLLVVAMVVDTFGGGLLAPFELIYGLRVAHLSLPLAGLLLSVGSAASIALGPLAGAVVDRFGPLRVVIAANLLGIGGCMSLLGLTDAWGYGLAAVLLSGYLRIFWASFVPMVASLTPQTNLDQWFGRFRGARSIGLTAGQGLSGLAFVLGAQTGLMALVVVDAVSFAVAIALTGLAAAQVYPRRGWRAEAWPVGGAYRAAISDRVNLALAGLNVVATTLIVAPVLGLPVFLLQNLGQPNWTPGVVAGLTTATAAVGLVAASRLVRGRRRLRNLQLALAVFALALGLLLAAPVVPAVMLGLVAMSAVLLGIGEAIYAPTADALPTALAPVHLRGRYAALHQLAWGISETLAPALVGVALVGSGAGLWGALILLAILAIAGYRLLEGPTHDRDGQPGEVIPPASS